MIYLIRRFITAAILALFFFLTWEILKGHISLFKAHSSPSDTLNSAFYLLSTLVQGLSAILGITIAILFIAAQINTRTKYGRTLIEIYYKDLTTFISLSFLFTAIIMGIVTLGRSSLIGSHTGQYYTLLDLSMLISITAILLLIPLILLQLENINPYFIALKLSKLITVKRILNYNLVKVEVDKNKVHYSFITWGHQYSHDDPLGAFHEVIMESVVVRNRIMFFSLMRLLLKRIAKYSAVPFFIRRDRIIHNSLQQKVINFYYTRIRTPEPLKNKLAVALHILHYLVRRAHNMKKEWGLFDAVRKQFILHIHDLIEALNLRKDTEQIIDISLFAAMHICLDYAKVDRYGRTEPLALYYQLANQLYMDGKHNQAQLCIEILAFIKVRTSILPTNQKVDVEDELIVTVKSLYDTACEIADGEKHWLPGGSIADPWHDRIASNMYI